MDHKNTLIELLLLPLMGYAIREFIGYFIHLKEAKKQTQLQVEILVEEKKQTEILQQMVETNKNNQGIG